MRYFQFFIIIIFLFLGILYAQFMATFEFISWNELNFIHLTFFFLFFILAWAVGFYSHIWFLRMVSPLYQCKIKNWLLKKLGLCYQNQFNVLTSQAAIGFNILVFSGGTGFREINMSLARRTKNITRVVPIWDNGGSSKALRKSFNLIPVGDIRHALMTQAHGEGRVGAVVKLFNWRLSDSDDNSILKQELNSFIENRHPLIHSIEKSLANVIIGYLKKFAEHLPGDMELRYGSIGNFVLVGAYLSHHKDINTAIYVFRQLCSIQGNVWPVSLDNSLHINTTLDDQKLILGQENITKIDRSEHNSKVKRIIFNTNDDSTRSTQHLIATANPMVIDALQREQLIVYGPGSFFTSILPHMMVEGIAEKISQLNIPKVFIGNLMEDNESYGYNLEQLIDIFVTTANKYASHEHGIKKYISHILVNKSHTLNGQISNGRRYLKAGDSILNLEDKGVHIIVDDLESPWKRGQHDAQWISDYLMQFNLQ